MTAEDAGRLRTRLCAALGIEYPIVQAPIGSATTPSLAATVSNAGGLGHLAVTWRDREETEQLLRKTGKRTDAPFAANLVIDEAAREIPFEAHLETVLETGIDVVSLSFGDPTPYVARIHEAGATAVAAVGSAGEARRVTEAGVDVVVAQGMEGGGHVESRVTTTALVPRVADVVDVPVVAAGGIADGRGVAAALALGADGAWLGTRFVACEEADVHRTYRQRLRKGEEIDTRYTEVFDKGWPGTPHRVLENETVERWTTAGEPEPGERPGEDDIVARTEGKTIERYDEALATPEVSGDIDAMALYAGQGVGLIEETLPARQVVERLVRETEAAIDRTAGMT